MAAVRVVLDELTVPPNGFGRAVRHIPEVSVPINAGEDEREVSV
jgi:hypothetical protein